MDFGKSLKENGFSDALKFSNQQREQDIAAIMAFYPAGEVKRVERSELWLDKCGIDYSAHLADGEKETYDAKWRRKGAKKYWKSGRPEVAIELCSDVERHKLGWVYTAECDYFLFCFEDVADRFRIVAQLLKLAVRRFLRKWEKEFGVQKQKSYEGGRIWFSTCIFVPVDELKACCQAVAFGRKIGDDDNDYQ